MTERTAPRRQRPKGQETELLFREAARTVFARDGYLNARIEDIAAAAGRSPASFYNYFDSKEQVLAALAEDFHQSNRAAITDIEATHASDREFLRAAIALWVAHYRERLAEMSGVFQASMVQDGFRSLWSAIRADAIRMIASRIRRAQQQGFCPGGDALLMGSALSSMLEHFCFVWCYHGGDDIDVAFDEERAIDMLTDVWYHAIYWRAEPPE